MSKLCPNCSNSLEDETSECPYCGFHFSNSEEQITSPEENDNLTQTSFEEHPASESDSFEENTNPDFTTESIFCTNCGAQLEPGATFCIKCGQKINADSEATKKKRSPKNIKLIICIVLILAIILSCVGYFVYREYNRRQQIQQYETYASELYMQVKSSTQNFQQISTMYETAIGYDTYTSLLYGNYLTQYATALCSSEINEEEARREEIDKLYKNINKMDCNEEEIQDLSKSIKYLYDTYCSRYDVLILQDFTSLTFATLNMNTKDDLSEALQNNQKELRLLGITPDNTTIETDEESEETL